ncbi:MAG TPA: SUMF1/EgtB/PvdO family nonheme iron enzyme [Labilithrix sp.]|nr:SUMF1/EgtB/PvdO family nonheme iron enzyme [Labilithrix sp.]
MAHADRVLARRSLLALGCVALLAFGACHSDDDPADDASCRNAKKDPTETDVDCGGLCSTKCTARRGCANNSDCVSSLLCVKAVCAAKTSVDSVKNGAETDVDCGGPEAPPCDVGESCLEGTDCTEKVCAGGKCAPPSPTDGLKNGDETDIDCGGDVAPRCPSNAECVDESDCESDLCIDQRCSGPSTSDNVKNGNETDVDCGGGAPAPPCGPTKACVDGVRDCTSKVCIGNVCQAPTGNDGVQNGDETDIDCGGSITGAPRCQAGAACVAHEDCASNGCDFNHKCAEKRSCTAQLGGFTCGVGEVGSPNANHESCCAAAKLNGSNVSMDKYLVTAGRMRAFIERLDGNVRAFAKTTAGWKTAWDALVPSTKAEADIMLGSYWTDAPNDSNGDNSKRSCAPGSFGGHTYWTPPNFSTPSEPDFTDFSQDLLDVKALNCVGWHLARAFCSWEGGRLPTVAEITNAFRNGGTTNYPWGNSAPDQNANRMNHEFIYGYPSVPGRRLLAGGGAADIAWHVSPPGRFPNGLNAAGIEIAGNLIHWTSNNEYTFTWTYSWERHGRNLRVDNWKDSWPGEPNGYYALGFRCVYD